MRIEFRRGFQGEQANGMPPSDTEKHDNPTALVTWLCSNAT